jgi:hypothetical protein
MERAYDFNELINCANTLNQLAAIEYGDNGLKFGRVHNKQRNIWGELHPLKDGEVAADLADYSELSDHSQLVLALHEGLKEAQSLLRMLNMAPTTVAREKRWFLEPWKVEREDLKFWAYLPAKKVTAGEDDDGEVLREAMATPAALPQIVSADGEQFLHLEEDLVDDGLNPLLVAENECRDALADLMNEVEPPPEFPTDTDPSSVLKISPTVHLLGKDIFKSTLVSKLNGNPYLSKDWLTRVRNSIYFNNAEDYLSATSSSSTMLLGLGSDCGVFFLQTANLNTTSAVKATKRRKFSGKKGSPSNISAGGESGTWWIGRIQKIQKRVGTKWGICRNPVDLLNKPAGSSKKVPSNPTVIVLLNWFQKVPGHLKYKYNGSDS